MKIINTFRKVVWVGLILLVGCHGNGVKKADIMAANTPVDSPTMVGQVVGIGRVEPASEITNLAVNTGGLVQTIHRQKGQVVRRGEVLLTLQNTVEQARIEQWRSRLVSQQEQIRLAEKVAEQAVILHAFRQKNLSRAQNLYAKQAQTAEQVERVQADYDAQQGQLETAQGQLSLARARLTELTREVQTAQAEADLKTVRAPSDGTLLDLNVQPGSAVQPLATFGRFAPAGETVVVAEVDELYANRIRSGQMVIVRLVGHREVLSTGRVQYVAPYLRRKSLFSERAGDLEDRRVREVRVVLPNTDKLLFNTRVEVTIQTN